MIDGTGRHHACITYGWKLQYSSDKSSKEGFQSPFDDNLYTSMYMCVHECIERRMVRRVRVYEFVCVLTRPPGYGWFSHSSLIRCLLTTQQWTIATSCIIVNDEKSVHQGHPHEQRTVTLYCLHSSCVVYTCVSGP